jgi:hypothetical protein
MTIFCYILSVCFFACRGCSDVVFFCFVLPPITSRQVFTDSLKKYIFDVGDKVARWYVYLHTKILNLAYFKRPWNGTFLYISVLFVIGTYLVFNWYILLSFGTF